MTRGVLKLGKTRIIEDANIRLVKMPHFEPNFHLHFQLKHGVVFYNITYHSKARYAYCDNPFSVFLLLVSFSYTIEGKASIYEERLLIV